MNDMTGLDKNRMPEVAARLKLLRLALKGGTQAAFAVKHGFTYAQWNNLERGYPLTHTVAISLCNQIPGLSLDWLYFGRDGGLTVNLLRALQAISSEDVGDSSKL